MDALRQFKVLLTDERAIIPPQRISSIALAHQRSSFVAQNVNRGALAYTRFG